MAGLRARQKEARSERILGVASELFRKVGYAAARVEDIAEAADLSVGTYYNYFENKADLLLAMVVRETEEILLIGEATIAGAFETCAQALDELIGAYYANCFVYTTKEMWRIAMAQMILRPESPFSQRYIALDEQLTRQMCACLRKLQGEGVVRPDVNTDALGELVFNNVNMMFIQFVRDDAMTTSEVRAAVERLNAPLARLISPGRAPAPER